MNVARGIVLSYRQLPIENRSSFFVFWQVWARLCSCQRIAKLYTWLCIVIIFPQSLQSPIPTSKRINRFDKLQLCTGCRIYLAYESHSTKSWQSKTVQLAPEPDIITSFPSHLLWLTLLSSTNCPNCSADEPLLYITTCSNQLTILAEPH